jgi:hypothetical protein
MIVVRSSSRFPRLAFRLVFDCYEHKKAHRMGVTAGNSSSGYGVRRPIPFPARGGIVFLKKSPSGCDGL